MNKTRGPPTKLTGDGIHKTNGEVSRFLVPRSLRGVNIIRGWDGWAGRATLHDTDDAVR